MSDLISRSALIEYINSSEFPKRYIKSKESIQEILRNIINEQPTAYDLDKVVESLEGKALGGIHGCQWIPLESAIDIVRGGGANE